MKGITKQELDKSLVNEISSIDRHIDDGARHVTQEEKDRWDSKVLKYGGYLVGVVDFNNIEKNTFYHVGDIDVDNSSGVDDLHMDWSLLWDYETQGGYRYQKLVYCTHGRTFTRSRTEVSWSPWQQDLRSVDISPVEQITSGSIFDYVSKAKHNITYMIASGYTPPDVPQGNEAHLEILVGTGGLRNTVIWREYGSGSAVYKRDYWKGQNHWINNWIRVPNIDDYNSLFQSVSNGKSAIANAIAQKGVATSATAEFATMANNIRAIPQGKKFALGTVVSSTQSLSFNTYGGSGTAIMPYVHITGYNFTPSFMYVFFTNNSFSVYNGFRYYDDAQTGSIKEVIKVGFTGTAYNSSYTVIATGNAFVGNVGALLPVIHAGYTYYWYAFE